MVTRVTVTPEERYLLILLADGTHQIREGETGGLRAYVVNGRPGQGYRIDRAMVRRLVALGYLVHSPESGGNPEITDAGRNVVKP